MDHEVYERKINDVIMKCPIEAGIEILVYRLLDSIIDPEQLSLVDINRLQKDRDNRLTTDAGISDIAVLSNDFEYRTNTGEVFGFIEIKAVSVQCLETKQITGQMKKVAHYLYTNGLVWKYYFKNDLKWTIQLTEEKLISVRKKISIKKERFRELIDKLSKIQWNESL